MNSLSSSFGTVPKRQRHRHFLFASLAFLLILPACIEDEEQTLTISGNIKIDSQSTKDYVNFFFTPLDDLILSPLAVYDPYADTYSLILASDVLSYEGGRVWEVKLLKGVRFHDGMSLTAKDVAFSIGKRRLTNTKLNLIRQVDVIDTATLRLTFDTPLKEIFEILNIIYVYPSHLLEKVTLWRKEFLGNPVGSGPYVFKGWLKNGMEFVANKEYFGGKPNIGRIVYLSEDNEGRRLRSLLQGEADIMMPVSPKVARFLEKDSKFYVNKLPLPYYTALFLNVRSELFSDRRLRQAVNMAVNREDLIEKGVDGAGLPAYSPFTEEMLPRGYAVRPIKYDPKGALQMLESSGWRDTDKDGILDKRGRRLKLKLLYLNASAEYKKVADVLAGQLYEIGMEVEMEGISYKESDNLTRSFTYDGLLSARNSFYPEAVWQSAGSFVGSTDNYSGYGNVEADALFESLKGSVESGEVKEIYAMIDRIIREDAPASFLYTPVSYAAANRRFTAAKGYQGGGYDNYRLKDWEYLHEK